MDGWKSEPSLDTSLEKAVLHQILSRQCPAMWTREMKRNEEKSSRNLYFEKFEMENRGQIFHQNCWVSRKKETKEKQFCFGQFFDKLLLLIKVFLNKFKRISKREKKVRENIFTKLKFFLTNILALARRFRWLYIWAFLAGLDSTPSGS